MQCCILLPQGFGTFMQRCILLLKGFGTFFATGNARQPLPRTFSPQEMRGSLSRGLFRHRKCAAASAGEYFCCGRFAFCCNYSIRISESDYCIV